MIARRPAAVALLVFPLAIAATISLAAPPEIRTPTVDAPGLGGGPKDNRRSIVVDDDWADHEVAPNRVLIRFRSDLAAQGRANLLAEMEATVAHSFERLVPGLRCLEIEESIAEFLERYRFRGDVLEFIEPDYVGSVASAPVGASRHAASNSNWGLSRIDIVEARDQLWPDRPENPLVAIIDSGIDLDHRDLRASLWRNRGEIPGNDIDDDGNGFVDDVHGYNWSESGDADDPTDRHGHGTHVAGTVGARYPGYSPGDGWDTASDLTGVCRRARLMALKALTDENWGYTSWWAAAVEYAALNGAKVANMSLSSSFNSNSLYLAIEAAGDVHGMIVVASAGNGASNDLIYPAGYDLDNIISVASIDSAGQLSSFSSYGSDWVDLGAPGSGIYSTLPDDGYGNKSGTSMAAPHVAGVAAMLHHLSSRASGGARMHDVIDAVLESARPLASLSGITETGGELNALDALDRFMTNWMPTRCSTPGVFLHQGATNEVGGPCNLFTNYATDMVPLGPDGWHGFLPDCGASMEISGCDPADVPRTAHDPYVFELGGLFGDPGRIYTISGCHPAGLELVSQLTYCGEVFACAGPAADGCESGFSYRVRGRHQTWTNYRNHKLVVGSASAPDPGLVRELQVTVSVSHPGDLDDDGRTDGADLALLLADWGACSGCLTDFDRDGVVGGSDLAVILGWWGDAPSPQTCESATPIELDTPTAFTYGPESEHVALGGCIDLGYSLRSVQWYEFTATSTGEVGVHFEFDRPAGDEDGEPNHAHGFAVMSSCDPASTLASSNTSYYFPDGSCFSFWADEGETYRIAAGTTADTHLNAPTSGSGVITLLPR